MPWPLIKLVPKQTKFTYVKFAGFAAIFSVAAVLATFVSISTGGFRENPFAVYQAASGTPLQRLGAVFADGFNLGIDFKGGVLLEMRAPGAIPLERMRTELNSMDLGDVQVQNFGDQRAAQVRFEAPASGNADAMVSNVRARIAALIPGVSFPRVEVVGPKVSGELFASGILALGLAIVFMLIYIWFRFEWNFGLGGVLALFHDTILTLGLFSIFRLEFTLTIIAALLTIIGYSMNDTVVVFDRMRENLRKYKRMPLSQLIDLSLNETLSRTIITGCTALLALVGLLYFGGQALSGFAIAMIFGILVGTYSSLYVAAPAVMLWGVKRVGAGARSEEEADNMARHMGE
jgi:preprotein translocase SecF subunit